MPEVNNKDTYLIFLVVQCTLMFFNLVFIYREQSFINCYSCY